MHRGQKGYTSRKVSHPASVLLFPHAPSPLPPHPRYVRRNPYTSAYLLVDILMGVFSLIYVMWVNKFITIEFIHVQNIVLVGGAMVVG